MRRGAVETRKAKRLMLIGPSGLRAYELGKEPSSGRAPGSSASRISGGWNRDGRRVRRPRSGKAWARPVGYLLPASRARRGAGGPAPDALVPERPRASGLGGTLRLRAGDQFDHPFSVQPAGWLGHDHDRADGLRRSPAAGPGSRRYRNAQAWEGAGRCRARSWPRCRRGGFCSPGMVTDLGQRVEPRRRRHVRGRPDESSQVRPSPGADLRAARAGPPR